MTRQKLSIAKNIFRFLYVCFNGGISVINFILPGKKTHICVYYSGARSGDVGGPLVKVKRLREYFPEYIWRYNIVYSLSNAPYLPAFSYFLLRMRGVPVIHNQNGVFYAAWFSGDWVLENKKMAIAYHAADWVFYQSEFCKIAADKFLGKRSGPGEILYNAIDTNHFIPAQNTIPVFTYLITGKIGEHLYYRLESTIIAFSKVILGGVEARLIIAGWVHAKVKDKAVALAKQLDVLDLVVFQGEYTQIQAPKIYQSANVYVMTKHNDPCPNTVLEAMSCGLPVVYSDTGGVRELVGEDAGIGVFCEHGWEISHSPNSDALAIAMIQIHKKYEFFAKAARKRAVDNFDIKYWIFRHHEVFDSLRKNKVAK